MSIRKIIKRVSTLRPSITSSSAMNNPEYTKPNTPITTQKPNKYKSDNYPKRTIGSANGYGRTAEKKKR